MDEEHPDSPPPPMPDRPGSMPPGPPTAAGGGLSEPGPSRRPTPGPTSTDRTPGLLTLLGGVLVVLGSFLPYLTVSVAGASTSASGTSAGIGVLILGGFAIVKGMSSLSPRMMPIRLATPLLTAGLLAVLLVIRWNDIHDAIRTLQAELPGVTASVGIGYWIDVVGTALILAAGFMDLAARRRA
jgi:hypothetical protein